MTVRRRRRIDAPKRWATRSRSSMRTALLVGKVRVVERSDAFVIPTAEQNAAQLGSCRSRTARQNQGGISKVDERDFATVLDAPPTPERGGQTRLPTMGDLGRRDVAAHDVHCR